MSKELEIYIHIPFCVKKCEYCDFLSGPAPERTQIAYVEALMKEIAYYGSRIQDREVTTVYIGGGTPSWLQARYMEMILNQLYGSFKVLESAEISIECNPGTLTKEKLLTYKRLGINRLSIGLQSTMNDELQTLGRIHTYEQFLKNYHLARECGFKNINVDIMSALPNQTEESFAHTLSRVIQLQPEHISAYSLIIEKGTPFYEMYKFDDVRRHAGMETKYLPSEETEYQIYKMTQHFLKKSGYEHYEISNYAKPGYACRHNAGYWQRKDYLGLGLGAASLIDNVRYDNLRNLDEYIQLADQIREQEFECETGKEVVLRPGCNLHSNIQCLSRKEQMEEFMFLGLRMAKGVSRFAFAENFGVQIDGIYSDVFARLEADGLIEKREGCIRLSDRGRDISNYVLSQFLLS